MASPPASGPAAPATSITYIGGRATALTLRRCKLALERSSGLREYVFEQDVIRIGATEDNDLVIDDETVSRLHCRIFREGDSYLIADAGSTNGTFVNGVRVREAYLHENCTITLGTTDIRFRWIDERLRIVPSDRERCGGLVGRDPRMREIYALLEKIAPTDATVLIEGETGTGKKAVARAIHQQSRRRGGPFIVFDCSAAPENVSENELFGCAEGAAGRGTTAARQGVFELARGGTVVLDEVGELAPDLQSKLLRVLEQREVRRASETNSHKVDVRIVVATSRDLEAEVHAGRFREDLLDRLNALRLRLPPLRDRIGDVELLTRHFLAQGRFNRDHAGAKKVTGLGLGVLEQLTRYHWPGNVRELREVVRRAVGAAGGAVIELDTLPDHIVRPRTDAVTSAALPKSAELLGGTFKDAKETWVQAFEADYIAHLLRKNHGNISHAAREAAIDRKHFRKLMKKYGIRPPDD